jgi:hypothetical protein
MRPDDGSIVQFGFEHMKAEGYQKRAIRSRMTSSENDYFASSVQMIAHSSWLRSGPCSISSAAGTIGSGPKCR